jgi:predicted transcriptional regulator
MQVANINAKEIQLIATITRADGTVEELGVIDYYHKNPIKRFIWKLKKLLERK